MSISPEDGNLLRRILLLEEGLAQQERVDRLISASVGAGGLRSSDYVEGSDGWRVAGDGSAEFNDVSVRGTLITSGAASGDSFQSTHDDGYIQMEIDAGSTGTYSTAGYLSTQSSGVALVSNQYDPTASRTGSSWSATGVLVEDDYLRMQLYDTASSDVRCYFEFDLNDQIAMRGDGGILMSAGERIRLQTDVGFDVVVAADVLDVNADLDVSGDLGLFGASPASKQTVSGSRGGNAALQSLLTALETYGLITDSTV